MSVIFGKVGFIHSIFDNEDEEEQEDFFIEEIDIVIVFSMSFNIFLKKIMVKLVLKKFTMNLLIYRGNLDWRIFFCTIPSYQFFAVRNVLISFVSLT